MLTQRTLTGMDELAALALFNDSATASQLVRRLAFVGAHPPPRIAVASHEAWRVQHELAAQDGTHESFQGLPGGSTSAPVAVGVERAPQQVVLAAALNDRPSLIIGDRMTRQ